MNLWMKPRPLKTRGLKAKGPKVRATGMSLYVENRKSVIRRSLKIEFLGLELPAQAVSPEFA
jgi:hypothetical protein